MLKQIPYVLLATVISFVYVAYTLGVKSGDGKLLAELIIGFQFISIIAMSMKNKIHRAWLWSGGLVLCNAWFMFEEKIARLFV